MTINHTTSYNISRSLHWLCAATYVFLAVSMPIALDLVENATERRLAHDVHQSVAAIFTCVLALRLLWIYLSKSTGLKTEFKLKWQFYMARLNHGLLYFLMVTTPLSGFAFKLTSGKAIKIFGTEVIAPIEAITNEDWEYYISEFHLLIISIFYVLIALHITGAVMHIAQKFKDRHHAKAGA